VILTLTEGRALGEPQEIESEEVRALRAIHPKSDLPRLLRQSMHTLRLDVIAARTLYHGGTSLWDRQATTRSDLIRELLTLRARFARLSPAALLAQRDREEASERHRENLSNATQVSLGNIPVDSGTTLREGSDEGG